MKLLIEVWGRMYQDWDNEVFRWDTDNYLKLTLGDKEIFSGQFSQLEEGDEDSAFAAVTNEVEALEYYKLWEMLSLSFKTESGDDLKLGYAYCDLVSSGDTLVKYGKYHLKKEIEVGEDFKFSDLAFVRLGNIANGIPSGEPYFASLISCVGHGEIVLREVNSNIKDQYNSTIPDLND
tara:strand:- start:199 stop:732 length:534 start_codon:yes stop_codon:yes gene_type:complete